MQAQERRLESAGEIQTAVLLRADAETAVLGAVAQLRTCWLGC